MGMGFAPTWLRQVSPPLLHKTTLTTDYRPFCVPSNRWPIVLRHRRRLLRHWWRNKKTVTQWLAWHRATGRSVCHRTTGLLSVAPHASIDCTDQQTSYRLLFRHRKHTSSTVSSSLLQTFEHTVRCVNEVTQKNLCTHFDEMSRSKGYWMKTIKFCTEY